MDTERLNQLIWSMGLKFRADLVQQTTPVPDWFPVHQAFTLATTHLFFTLPDAVRRTLRHTTPEQLAQRGKRLGATVSPLTVWTFAYSYLVGREILLDSGVITPRTGAEDLDLVLDFWRRLSFAHRGDGHLDNSEAAATNVFLPVTIIQRMYDALLPIDASIRRRVEQFLAATDEYLLLLNGEARLGTADSGPYPLNVERVLIVRDPDGYFIELINLDGPPPAPEPGNSIGATFRITATDANRAVHFFETVFGFGVYEASDLTDDPLLGRAMGLGALSQRWAGSTVPAKPSTISAASHHAPFSSAARTRYHLLTKPAVPGTPMRLKPPSTMPKDVSGITRARPESRDNVAPPTTATAPPMSRNSAPLVTA